MTAQQIASGVFYLCDPNSGCCMGNPCKTANGYQLSFTKDTMTEINLQNGATITASQISQNSSSFMSWNLSNMQGTSISDSFNITSFSC